MKTTHVKSHVRGANLSDPSLNVFQRHQKAIALSTLKMSDVGAE